jgi:hypothetical protein
LNDAHVASLEFMGQFMEMEVVLMKENNNLIKKVHPPLPRPPQQEMTKA